MKTLQPFPYSTADASGNLKVIVVAASESLPVGTIKKDGLAYHPDGSLYVVFA